MIRKFPYLFVILLSLSATSALAQPTGVHKGAFGAHTADASAVVISGVNTAGTVRVNCLASLDALINICANGVEIAGIAIGCAMLFRTFRVMTLSERRRETVLAILIMAGGLAIPSAVNWAVAAARNANLLS